MKKITLIFSIIFLSAMAFVSCNDGNRIDQKGGCPIPAEPTVVGVKSVPGGAVLQVSIPDDPYLKGVVATYERNGEIVEARISRYLDTLVVEGFADELEHEVTVRSFNADNGMSEGQVVKITPLVAPVKTATYEFFNAFGGFKACIKNNPTCASLALVVQADTSYTDQDLTYEQRKWKDVSTFFTESDSVMITRRGLSPVPTVLAVHLRDKFGNTSPVELVTVTPRAEAELTKPFAHHPVGIYPVADGLHPIPGHDNFVNDAGGGGVGALWDKIESGTGKFFLAAKGNKVPTWLTIDLKVPEGVVLSRIATRPRADYSVFSGGNIREWEFWGIYDEPNEDLSKHPDTSNDPSRHGFSQGWFLLAKGEQYKPSGYAPNGSVDGWTQEDREHYLHNTEYEVDNTNPLTPRAYEKIRYLRIVVMNTFATWEFSTPTAGWFIGEITPYGQVY